MFECQEEASSGWFGGWGGDVIKAPETRKSIYTSVNSWQNWTIITEQENLIFTWDQA